MASELTEAKQTCEFLERDNADLYANIAELKASAVKAADIDTCRRQLLSAEVRVVELEQQLSSRETLLQTQSSDLNTAQQEIVQLCEANHHLQAELRRLQEKSTSTLTFVNLCNIVT